MLESGRWEDGLNGDSPNFVGEITFARWKWQNIWAKLKAKNASSGDSYRLAECEQWAPLNSPIVAQISEAKSIKRQEEDKVGDWPNESASPTNIVNGVI